MSTNRYLKKYSFISLALISFIMVYIVYERLGINMHLIGEQFLLSSNHDINHDGALFRAGVLTDKETEDIANKHGHDHEEEVGFILHESDLGAPEFIGRNQKIENLDDYRNDRLDASESDDGSKNDASVAIGCAITTKNEPNLTSIYSLTNLPFFKSLLSSFCTTATRGFSYNFYVAHDHTDTFFVQDGSHKFFTRIFYEQILRRCPRRINATLHLVECKYAGKPAWSQNDAMMSAYIDGMDYFYRVNDDTVMQSSGWTEKFIDELQRFDPPNVGVVGPWFKEGNVMILTHDFVHRSHLDIFGFYYPRVFTDWFADDWITNVYWPHNCRKVPGTRVHHTQERGQRYVAHYELASRVRIESDIGKGIINRYIKRLKDGFKPLGLFANTTTQNVVSMSLHGNELDLLYGSIRYSQLLPMMYPSWRLRVYAPPERNQTKLMKIVLRKLEFSDVEVVRVGERVGRRMAPDMWRYLVMDDLTVERFIIRDAVTRPSDREFVALKEWINRTHIGDNLNTGIYCIRDHPSHGQTLFYAGLLGGLPRVLNRLLNGIRFQNLLARAKNERAFLKMLGSKLENSEGYLCHDSVSCKTWNASLVFPMLRSGNEYIGEKFDLNDQLIDSEDISQWPSNYRESDCVFVRDSGFTEEAVTSVIRLRPIFWSQDYHVTPIMDIQSLLRPIGVKVIDNSLSFYCAKIGTCARNLKVINSENGMNLDAALIKDFYVAYANDTLMSSVNAFVCTLPVSMCEAFEPFKKSMVVIATIRYEQGRPEPKRWRKLNKFLSRINSSETSVLAANNLYDAKYIEYFTGLKPLLLPNYCAYLIDTYTPTRKQFLVSPIHSTELNDVFFAELDGIVAKRGLDVAAYPLRELYAQYLYSDLVAHPGIIYIPYQVSMISLTEQYRMNIPLFFPTRKLLTSWHLKHQVVRQRTWAGYNMRKANGSAIQGRYPKVPDPNNDVDEEAVFYWLQFSDFYQWPHIIKYESVSDLVEKLVRVDLNEISRRMRLYNEQVRRDIKRTWSKILLRITKTNL